VAGAVVKQSKYRSTWKTNPCRSLLPPLETGGQRCPVGLLGEPNYSCDLEIDSQIHRQTDRQTDRQRILKDE
jgi:hypothetical protein